LIEALKFYFLLQHKQNLKENIFQVLLINHLNIHLEKHDVLVKIATIIKYL